MKKLLASVLCIATVMSLAACGSKKPVQITAAAPSETTTAAVAAPASSEKKDTPAIETQKPNPASEYVKDRVEKLTINGFTDEDGEKTEDEDIIFHFPVLQIKSSYAEQVNKEMDKIFADYNKEYKSAVKDNVTPDLYETNYIAYLTKDGILSLVFVEGGANDCNEYHVYNIDVKTGEKVDNARIAQVAGVSDIRKAAMDALQALYNNDENGNFKIKNYKVVKKVGEKKDEMDRDVEKAFSEKHLNDKMKIGLTDEGKMFFISEFETGAGEFSGMYDVNGKDLYDENNPCFVGEHYPEEEDEGDEGEDAEDLSYEEDED